MSRKPVITVLDEDECTRLLASQSVGRLAFTFRDRVDIEPIHFVFDAGRIVGRTQFGTKVEVLAHHPWVAFEVDEVRALFSWRSVVVHGRLEFPDPEGSAVERDRHARAVEAFRRLIPDAFTAADPTPMRDLVFTIPVQEISGRASTPGAEV